MLFYLLHVYIIWQRHMFTNNFSNVYFHIFTKYKFFSPHTAPTQSTSGIYVIIIIDLITVMTRNKVEQCFWALYMDVAGLKNYPRIYILLYFELT